MGTVSVYLVADYNPKYLDGSIKSAVSRLIYNVQNENDILDSFEIEVEDKVEGLSQNSAKAVMTGEVETQKDSVEMIEELSGELRMEISDQAIYSVTVNSSDSAKKYAHQY